MSIENTKSMIDALDAGDMYQQKQKLRLDLQTK